MMFHPPSSPLAHHHSTRRYGVSDDDNQLEEVLPSSTPPRLVSSNTNNASVTAAAVTPETVIVVTGESEDDDKSVALEEEDLPPKPLKRDHNTHRGNNNNDRHIFVTLYIMMFLALGGLTFASTRYIQAKLASNGNGGGVASSMEGSDDVTAFNRDNIAFKTQLEAVLSDVVRSSDLLQVSSPQARAVEWLVFQDRMLTMEDLNTEENNGGDPFKVYQRYALMALYFATSGQLWEEIPWTDNTMVHTCDFVGVDCDEKRQVVILNLYLRKLRGRIPDDLGLLTQLTSLTLNSNLLEGDIPTFLFDKLTNLESLDLSQNEFSSTLNPSISKLTNLKYLLLDQLTGLTGTLPESLKTLSNLRLLRLEQSQMKAPIFDFVPHWPKLETLDLKQSLFTGTIPTSIAEWENLKFLNMINSRINATNLPSEIGLMSNLVEFQVWSTTADGGTIPTELGNCNQLEVLSIQGSNFVGQIPSELGRLTKLYLLLLEGSLTGKVPSELGLLTNLNYLSLALNNIVGQLPEELGNVKQLARLQVHYTDLTGSIPNGVCNDSIDITRSCSITKCDCCRNPCHKN
ncbi:RHS repeat-associated core domain containing protein [Nitzschia inconspicua]|uniref:RHS repeat-associated core domain containing protein n=1 Tax=Nitzschia inconspicua TaxID=303405 RepID=A0A9K3KS22_9STRA|nr:RHS repeat-associated core domain containing protein [Nitzschia inconspicua]